MRVLPVHVCLLREHARTWERWAHVARRPQAEFGYTRKDVLIISGGVLVGGYALYNGLIVRALPSRTPIL